MNLPWRVGRRRVSAVAHWQRCAWFGFALAVAAAVGSGTVAAQSPSLELVAANGFNEVMTERPKVSGQEVVGLVLGPRDGFLNLDRVLAVLPGNERSDTRPVELCVRITTRDARYYSLNAYRSPFARPQPAILQLQHRSQFKVALERYMAEDVAVKVMVKKPAPGISDRTPPGEDCDEESGDRLLAAAFGRTTPATLTVYLNVPSQGATLRLESGQPSSDLAATECVPIASGVNFAFTMRCELILSKSVAAGSYMITYQLRGLTSISRRRTVSVLLPNIP